MTRKLPVPHYRQGTTDFACGPVCVCMAIDCLLISAGLPKLGFVGIKKIEKLTMGGRLWSSSGTGYAEMKRAIRRSGFGCREVGGGSDRSRERHLSRAIDAGHPVVLGCTAKIGGARYKHYVVLRGIDEMYLYVRDPFPNGRPTKVLLAEFEKNGQRTSWGSSRWGIEVYPRK